MRRAIDWGRIKLHVDAIAPGYLDVEVARAVASGAWPDLSRVDDDEIVQLLVEHQESQWETSD